MVITKDVWLPSYEELETEEIKLSSPALKAGATHFGRYCDNVCKVRHIPTLGLYACCFMGGKQDKIFTLTGVYAVPERGDRSTSLHQGRQGRHSLWPGLFSQSQEILLRTIRETLALLGE
jgi:hypothetical protein